MILPGHVIGTMAPGRGRLDRTWLWFSSGADFAASDPCTCYQVAEGTYMEGGLLDTLGRGRPGVGIAAWQPSVAPRGATTCRASSSPSCRPRRLGLLIYDHFPRVNPRARAVGAALLAVVAPPVADPPAEPRQPGATRACRRDGLAHRAGQPLRAERALEQRRGSGAAARCCSSTSTASRTTTTPTGTRRATRCYAARHRLEAPGGRGTAYRVGGDEFCVLAPWPRPRARRAHRPRARRALPSRATPSRSGARPACAAARRGRRRRRRRCASPTGGSTPRSTAAACPPGCSARACCAAR